MMKQGKHICTLALLAATHSSLMAQTEATDTVGSSRDLQSATVKTAARTKSAWRTENTELIGQHQLLRAACCNLGESFTTNPPLCEGYEENRDFGAQPDGHDRLRPQEGQPRSLRRGFPEDRLRGEAPEVNT